MTEEIQEEIQDSETPEEEEDFEETEEEVEEEEPDYKELFEREQQKSKGMYKRLKSEQAKKTPVAKAESVANPFEIAEITSALQGLDELERDRLIKEAKLGGISLSEAKKSEDYKLWQKGYKGKVVSKTPAPSTKQGTQSRGGTLTEQLANATPAERNKLLIKAGLVSDRYSSEEK
jgi:hypothetical protein